MTVELAGVFSIPMRVAFRGLLRREGALLLGPAGYGEFSPFAEYGPRLSARWLAAAREAARGEWPLPVRRVVPVNVTIPAVPAEAVAELVAASGGCRTAKVKVTGAGDGEDEQRVAATRAALGSSGRIRIDVNGAWTVDQAAVVIRRLARHDLEYVEQPCATVAELAALRPRVDVPIAVDESVRLAEDPLRVPGLTEAADIVVLKAQPLGGVRAALRVAEAYGLPAVVSSAVETSVGLAANVALAAALPQLPYACGIGTALLLADDVTVEPLLPVDGVVAVGEAAQMRVDPAALIRCAAPPWVRDRWVRRLALAAEQLDGPQPGAGQPGAGQLDGAGPR